MIKNLKAIYDNEIYTVFIIILALISLFANIPDAIDLGIDGIFILDLIVATILFINFSEEKSLVSYFKMHTADMISCVPVQFLSIFKTFRLLRLVRISRLFKLQRTINISIK